MNRQQYIKLFGFIGALLTGGVACLSGNYTEGIGIIAASISSAGFMTRGG